MPKFASNSGLVRKDNISLQKIELPEISLGGKTVSYDYHKEMESMFQGTKEKKEQETLGLALRDFDNGTMTLALHSFNVGGEWNGLSLLTESEQHLEQAKKFVTQEEFQMALPLLEQVLHVGFNQEAVYLKSYCLVSLNRAEESLNCIALLRNANLPALLQTRVALLNERIRKAMREVLFAEMALRKKLGQITGESAAAQQQMIRRLQQLVALDPEMGLYHYLLSVKLLETNNLEMALRATILGLQETTTEDRFQLENFHAYLTMRYLQVLVRPVMRHVKQREFQRARNELNHIDLTYRNDPRLLALNTYLLKLEKHPPKPGSDFPSPDEKPEILQEIFQIMVGADLEQFEELMNRRQAGEAESLLRQARQIAATYPPINFALASHVYLLGRLEYMLTSGNLNKDGLVRRLREAYPYAQVAVGLENGKNLLSAINDFIRRLDEELKVDQVILGFVSLMERAQGGIRDRQQCKTVQGQIKRLQDQLNNVQAEIQSPDILKTMKQVSEALDINQTRLQEIDQEIQDADLLNPIFQEYDQLMQQIQSGIQSVDQLNKYQSQFQELQRQISRIHSTIRTQTAREALTQLGQGVSARLQEINSISSDIQEQERNRSIIEPLIQEFNQTMQALERNKISSRYELDRALESFRLMKQRAEQAQQTVSSQDAKTTISQLLSAINNVLNQLNRH